MLRFSDIWLTRPALWLIVAALVVAGCPDPATQSPPGPATKEKKRQALTVLIVDDPELGQAIAREWRSRTEEDLKVEPVTIAQLAAARRLPGDAIIFPSGLLGQLAERGLILPIEPVALEEPSFDYRDIFELLRRQEMRWGNRTFATPLGSPQLLLAYRTDVFARLGLSPPADWREYQTLVGRLTDRSMLGEFIAADQQWQATVEPLAEGWASQLLLARAAAYAMHRDQVSPLLQFDSLDPLVDQPPYVRALEELVAAARDGGFSKQRLTPAEALAALRAGKCGMAICCPENGARGPDSKENPTNGKIGFASLPGSREAYRFATKAWEARADDESVHVPLMSVAGCLAAVTSTTAAPARAQGLVLWLAGREVSGIVAPHAGATTLFRNSQVQDAGRWTGNLDSEAARQYGDILARTLNSSRAFPALRLPGRADYLSALDEGVQQAISGEKDPRKALGDVRRRWVEITEKLGVANQKRANARSLGEERL